MLCYSEHQALSFLRLEDIEVMFAVFVAQMKSMILVKKQM